MRKSSGAREYREGAWGMDKLRNNEVHKVNSVRLVARRSEPTET